MIIGKNPLVSKILIHHNLVLNCDESKLYLSYDNYYSDKGEAKSKQENRKEVRIFLTDNHEQIIKLLDLPEIVGDKSIQADSFYPYLLDNPKIPYAKFIECKDKEPELIKGFSLFLKDIEASKKPAFIRMSKDSILEFFMLSKEQFNFPLIEKYLFGKHWIHLKPALIHKFFPNYSVQTFQRDLDIFKTNNLHSGTKDLVLKVADEQMVAEAFVNQRTITFDNINFEIIS